MTKRIKITDPKDLREGMRVEVEWKDGQPCTGQLYKPTQRPSCVALRLDFNNDHIGLRDIFGEVSNVKSIHRLIDGIEDVVVGDLLIDDDYYYVKVLDVRGQLVDLSHYAQNLTDKGLNRYHSTISIFELKELDYSVLIEKRKSQKTELTETEAKEIIAEVKGEKIENIIIKKDE